MNDSFNHTSPLLRAFANLSGPSGLETEGSFAQEIGLVKAYLRDLIAKRNAAFSLISQLPDECMAKIFNFVATLQVPAVVAPTVDDFGPSSRPMLKPRLLVPLLFVCRQWYEIVMNYPALWAGIDSKAWSVRRAHVLLERSKHSPLSLSIDEFHQRRTATDRRGVMGCCGLPRPPSPPRPDSPWSMEAEDLRYILEKSHRRVESMDLVLATASFATLSAGLSQWQWDSLRIAKFAEERNHTNPNAIRQIPYLPLIKADILSSLTICGLCFDMDVSKYHFPSLRYLTWRFPLAETSPVSLGQVISLLANMPRLEELECDTQGRSYFQTGELCQPIITRLPTLKKITCKGTHASPILKLPRYIDSSSDCRLHYFIADTFPSVDRDLRHVFPGIVPSRLRSTQPTRLALLDREFHFNLSGIIFQADADDEKGTVFTPKPRTLLRFHTQQCFPPLVPRTDLVIRREIVKQAVNNDAEAMLTQICSLSSLRALTCSLKISPAVWMRGFSPCANLAEISLCGLAVAFQFAGALLLDSPYFLPALTSICVQQESPMTKPHSSVPQQCATSRPPDITWSMVLTKFTNAFSHRMGMTNERILRFIIRRDFVGCFISPDLVAETEAWLGLATVVGELALAYPEDS